MRVRELHSTSRIFDADCKRRRKSSYVHRACCVAVLGNPSELKSKKTKVQGKWQEMAYGALTLLGDGATRAALLEDIGGNHGHKGRWKESAQRGIQGCIDAGLIVSRGDFFLWLKPHKLRPTTHNPKGLCVICGKGAGL